RQDGVEPEQRRAHEDAAKVVGGHWRLSRSEGSRKVAANVRALGRADKGLCDHGPARGRRAETPFERSTQRGVDVRHQYQMPQIFKARHAAVGNPAWYDPIEMAEVGRHIEGDPVRRHPLADPDADCRNLAFAADPAGLPDPYADPSVADLPIDVEGRQRVDDPALEPLHQATDVAATRLEVEHQIRHPLPWPVIGVLTAAFGLVDGEALGVEQVLAMRGG